MKDLEPEPKLLTALLCIALKDVMKENNITKTNEELKIISEIV